MNKLVRIAGFSGKTLDLPQEVVERFDGKESELPRLAEQIEASLLS